MKRRMRFAGVKFIVFGAAWVAAMGLAVFGLWNWLAPAVFHLPAIGFWQAVGMLLLGRVLFGGFGGHRHPGHRARFARGWNGLRPGERERFRRALGHWRPDDYGQGKPDNYGAERA